MGSGSMAMVMMMTMTVLWIMVVAGGFVDDVNLEVVNVVGPGVRQWC